MIDDEALKSIERLHRFKSGGEEGKRFSSILQQLADESTPTSKRGKL